jgi:hypothetical protein
MSKVLSNKSPLQRLIASARMKELNTDPAVRAKSAATMRGKPFRGTRGGNGQLTEPQKKLHEWLGGDAAFWQMEYSIPSGVREWKHLDVDLACPPLKLAIECDGRSHTSTKQRARDAAKDLMLGNLGWTVLRFWNSKINYHRREVIRKVQDQINQLMAEHLYSGLNPFEGLKSTSTT